MFWHVCRDIYVHTYIYICPPKSLMVSIMFDFHFFKTLFLSHIHRRNGVMKSCVQRLSKFWPQTLSYRPAQGLPFYLPFPFLIYPFTAVYLIWYVQPSLFQNSAIFRYWYCASLKESCRQHVFFSAMSSPYHSICFFNSTRSTSRF